MPPRRMLAASPNFGPAMFANPNGMPANPNAVFINGIPVVNNLDKARQFATTLNTYEIITQSLYDSASYPTTGIANLTYFQNQVGAGTGVISGAAKTPEDTNMPGNGMMPNFQAYLATSMELDVQPAIAFGAANMPAVFGAQAVAASVNDVWKIRATGWLEFSIGSKLYLQEGPLMKFPASNDLELDVAVADVAPNGAGTSSMQSRLSYAKAVGPAYILSPNNLLLTPMLNFKVTLNWTTLETVNAQARIFVRMMGQLMRASQ